MANTARGHIEQLPSGSFRVHVYAGTDPVTGRPRRLRETCPDDATAAATLGRLLNEADGGRFPDRAATANRSSAHDRQAHRPPAPTAGISPVTGPVIHHGENRFRALPGSGNRGVDLHIVLPEAVHQPVVTTRRPHRAVAARPFPLLGHC